MYATQTLGNTQITAATHKTTAVRDQIATAVYSTRNYGQFKFDTFNRPIDDGKLAKLTAAIAAHDLLADNPILVSLENVVLDGQHRLKAAEALGVAIYYYFASDATIADVPEMNGMRSAWKSQDYLDVWCKRGAPDYIALRDFHRRFSWMTFSMAQDLCHYGDLTNATKTFIAGNYQANDLDFAEKVAFAVLDFRAIGFEYYRTSLFISVVANLLGNASYDHKRMVHQLKRQSAKLRPAVNRDDYMKIIDNIYNYNRRGTPYVELKWLNPNEAKYRPEMKAQRKVVK